LTDASIADLAQLLLSSSAAAGITHLDLSQNQLLTWRCCSALGQLLLADNSSAQQQQQQQPRQGMASFVAPHSNPFAADGPAEQTWQRSADTEDRRPLLSIESFQQRTLLRMPSSNSDPDMESSSSAVAAGMAQVALPQQLQPQVPLMLRALSLEGVALGDKGAAALVAALSSNQHLQVCVRVLHDAAVK
jgi:hypothetical protein